MCKENELTTKEIIEDNEIFDILNKVNKFSFSKPDRKPQIFTMLEEWEKVEIGENYKIINNGYGRKNLYQLPFEFGNLKLVDRK